MLQQELAPEFQEVQTASRNAQRRCPHLPTALEAGGRKPADHPERGAPTVHQTAPSRVMHCRGTPSGRSGLQPPASVEPLQRSRIELHLADSFTVNFELQAQSFNVIYTVKVLLYRSLGNIC